VDNGELTWRLESNTLRQLVTKHASEARVQWFVMGHQERWVSGVRCPDQRRYAHHWHRV